MCLSDSEYVFVLPNLTYSTESLEVCNHHSDVVYYVDYLRGQPEPEAEQGQHSRGKKTCGQEARAQKRPWLEKALAKKPGKAAAKQNEEEPDEEEPAAELDPDVVANVMALLEEKRVQMDMDHSDVRCPHEPFLFLQGMRG